jgi:uroporphyrin-III C-methyltransferase/precorrin-2 dehydrogenase/sirohydrochlorin ferrochelatase
MNSLYPAFLKLEGKPVLVVGGGAVAEQKIAGLLDSRADVTVIAPETTANILQLAAQGRLRLQSKAFQPGDTVGFHLVIGATDDRAVQHAVFEEAQRQGIPVNIVDVPDLCSFYTASIFRKGDLSIAVSTNGKSPTLGKLIRDRIRECFEHGYPELLERLGSIRPDVLESLPDYEARRKYFEQLVRAEVKVLEHREDDQVDRLKKEKKTGKVYLVGAGPGDPELISVKGLRVLRKADVLIYDALVSPGLLQEVPRSAEKYFVGKRAGRDCASQSEIHTLLIKHAREGKTVVRLKGGDPLIFGRGGEELKALREEEIEVEIVPGITAGTGVPASIGIPLTHRQTSSSVAFVTGHRCASSTQKPIDWKALRAIDTVVIYMGIRTIRRVIDEMVEAGYDPELPTAAIFAGTLKEELIVTSTLANLADAIQNIPTVLPGLIIAGNVVRTFSSRVKNNQPEEVEYLAEH